MKSALESIQYWFMKHGTSDNITTFAIIIVGIILVVMVYRILKSFHTSMVFFVLGLLGIGVFLYWVHNRNEPDFMTPSVEAVAGFLPKKDALLREVDTPK
ncbi:hypothetical protein GA003_20280 [Opitutia bacterium ISCC 52]|nr:hypothetical protein GA003_20280 [Opitutae bacterium ISCC 52]